jgi:hypothetical protein
MIRFPEIWQQYEQGELKELAPQQQTTPIQTGFKDIDTSTKTIDDIASFDDKPYLQKLKQHTSHQTTIKTLEAMLPDIEHAEENIAHHQTKDILHGHAIRVIRLGNEYDLVVEKQSNQLYESFSTAHALLAEAITPHYAQEVRAKTDNSHELLLAIYQIAQRRNMHELLTRDKRKKVQQYTLIKKTIAQLQQQIMHLQKEYDACVENAKGSTYSKKLVKKIKNVWGKGLLDRAKKAHFIEGIEVVEQLHETLLDFTKNPKPYQLQKQLEKQLGNTQTTNLRQENNPRTPPYQKQSTKEDIQATPTPLDKTTYSLTMHLRSMAYPENFQYFSLRRALLDTTPWSQRFETFNNALGSLAKEKNNLSIAQQDKAYLRSVAEGIYLAMEKPEKDFPSTTARKTYELLQTIIS